MEAGAASTRTQSLDHLRDNSIGLPQAEHAWVPHATADDYDEALRLCSEEAAKLLVDECVACDAGVAQACKPAPGFGTIARFTIPKLDATPAPFRPTAT